MSEEQKGSATLEGGRAPEIHAAGPCFTGTLENLTAGGSRPMPAAAIAKIRSDALALLSEVVRVYEAAAPGEVGAGGSAVAGAGAASATGLLYGRIQSGKTVAMISFVSAAVDNGFRCVIVLTSDNVKLVKQTTDRFGALDGPIAVDALDPQSWENDAAHIARHIGRSGVVFVCSKNRDRLDKLVEFLKQIGAPDYPALILDDEADQATLDANVNRRERAKLKGSDAQIDPTAIHYRVVEKLRTTLRHHVFLQVTATPYALLLQNVDSKLRPSFSRLLEPGDGYTGGEYFFEEHHVDDEQPPLVFVDDAESHDVEAGTGDPPEGLRNSIAFFLVAAGAQAIRDPKGAAQGQNFLCHTSQLKVDHAKLAELIRTYVDRVGKDLEIKKGEGYDRIARAYVELRKTLAEPPPLDEIVETVSRRLVRRRVLVVNAESDAEVGKSLNFIVGGNILGRGLTIENLLVTYYLRRPKTTQMDTMLQHARMYGYRRDIMEYTRVFLPHQLAMRFHNIHRIEQRLRRRLVGADLEKPIVIDTASELKATRRGVLDPNYVDVYEPGQQVYPHYPGLDEKSRKRGEKLGEEIRELIGGTFIDVPADRPKEIDFDRLVHLISEFPYDEAKDEGSWYPDLLIRVVEEQRARCNDRAFLYYRKMSRSSTSFATAALGGDSLKKLLSHGAPVFCAFRDDGKKRAEYRDIWYPSLVLDTASRPSLVLNFS